MMVWQVQLTIFDSLAQRAQYNLASTRHPQSHLTIGGAHSHKVTPRRGVVVFLDPNRLVMRD